MPSFETVQRSIHHCLRAGQTDRARRIADRWCARHDDDRTAIAIRAPVLAATARFAEARAIYEGRLACDAQSPELIHNYAVLLIDGATEGTFPKSDLARAEELLTGLDGDESLRPEFDYNLGNLYSSLGRFREARVRFHQFIASAPPAPEVLVNLANCYRAERRYSEAIDLDLQATALRPHHDMAWANLAQALCSGYFMTAGRRGHLLEMAELCCRYADRYFDGYSRSPEIVRQVRDYVRHESDVPPGPMPTSKWAPRFAPAREASPGHLLSHYEYVAARDHLFLDLLSKDPAGESPQREPPVCAGFSHSVGETERATEWFRIFNAIQWEFHAARTDYVMATWPDSPGSAVDSLTSYVDVGDDARFSHSNRRLLQTIASAMNVFDKIAFFLNSFLGLGATPRYIHFSGKHSILKRIKEPTAVGMRENLSALSGMAADIDGSFFRRCTELRHAFTHRYVIPHDGPGHASSKGSPMWCSAGALEPLARDALMLAKAGIYYSVGLVLCHDDHVERQADVMDVLRFPIDEP